MRHILSGFLLLASASPIEASTILTIAIPSGPCLLAPPPPSLGGPPFPGACLVLPLGDGFQVVSDLTSGGFYLPGLKVDSADSQLSVTFTSDRPFDLLTLNGAFGAYDAGDAGPFRVTSSAGGDTGFRPRLFSSTGTIRCASDPFSLDFSGAAWEGLSSFSVSVTRNGLDDCYSPGAGGPAFTLNSITVAVPEPSMIFLSGLAALAWRWRRLPKQQSWSRRQ